jgi:hypothetical protein
VPGQDGCAVTTHILDGRVTHLRDDLIRYEERGLWLEVTACRLWYVRQNHPLEDLVPVDTPRYHVTVDPVDCMSCLVRMAAP